MVHESSALGYSGLASKPVPELVTSQVASGSSLFSAMVVASTEPRYIEQHYFGALDRWTMGSIPNSPEKKITKTE